MSRSRWLFILAFGGLIAALTLWEVRDYPRGRSIETAAKAQQNKAERASPRPRANGEKETAEDASPCEDASENKNPDLCQQWRMAQFAGQQVGLIERQLLASYFEIGLLVMTFGASLSLALVGIRTSRAELRAYVLPDDIVIIKHPFKLMIGVVFKNTGQTPAKNLHTRVCCAFLPPNDVADYPFEVGELHSAGSLGPGQTLTAKFVHADNNPLDINTASLRLKTLIGFAYGQATYTDAFDNARVTKFRAMYDPAEGVFVICTEGNEST